MSVRPYVSPVDRQQQRCETGLLLSAGRVAAVVAYQISMIDPCCRHRRSAANAGSVLLRAEAQQRLVDIAPPPTGRPKVHHKTIISLFRGVRMQTGTEMFSLGDEK